MANGVKVDSSTAAAVQSALAKQASKPAAQSNSGSSGAGGDSSSSTKQAEGISIKGLNSAQVRAIGGVLGLDTSNINTAFTNQFAQNMANYMNSDNRTFEQTNHYLNLANSNAEKATTPEEKQTWLSIANDFKGLYASDLYNEKDRLTTEGDALEKRQTYAKNVMRSTSAAMNGYGEGWSGYDYQLARNDKYTGLYNRLGKEIEDNKAALSAIESQIFDVLASDDIKAMRDRLANASDAKHTFEVYSALGAKNPHEAGMMKMNEQAEVDRFVESLGQKPQYYNFNDRMMGVGGNFMTKTVGAGMNLVAAGANEADFYNSLPDDLRMLVADPEAMSKATPEQLARMDVYRQQFNANGGNDGKIGQFADKTESWADKFDEASQREIEKAKQGLGQFGQFGIDMASTALDIGFDTATGLGLASMFARVAGQGIGEARRAGATSDQQIAYGLTQATIEILTEKMSDGLSLAYGRGVSTDIVEDVIKKLGASENGANLLRLLAGAIGEGGEEVISDLLNPFTKWIIDQNAKDNRTYELDPSELLRDFLLGSAMGLAGSVSEAATGGYAEKNGAIYNARVDSDIEAYSNLQQDKLNLADDTRKQMANIRAADGTMARAVIDGYHQGKEGGVSSQKLTDRINKMLNQPAEMRIFERETGQKIQGSTLAEQRASVREILKSEQFATDSIKAETQKKAEELKGKEADYEKNKARETSIYEKVLKLKFSKNGEVSPDMLLTKEEARIAEAAGWVGKADRAKYMLPSDAPTLRGKLSNSTGKVASKLKKGSQYKGEHRQDTLSGRIVQNSEALGYGYKGSPNQAYEDATGKTIEQANAEADAASKAAMEEEGAAPKPKGGDAAEVNYGEMSRAQIVELWRDHKLTDAQFGELMKKYHGWSEEDVRQHLARAKQVGADAEERKRDTLESKAPQAKANETEGEPSKPSKPDTRETTESEADRILKEIKENDSHIKEDHRPRGGGAVYWTPSKSTSSIQKLWERQRERLNRGQKMSRDAEFEAYTNEDGEPLTLHEAAIEEQTGGKVYRWRAIDKTVVDDMLKATPEKPFVIGMNYKGEVTAFKFDGTNLYIVHANDDSGKVTIKDSGKMPASEFQQAAIYLTQSLSGENSSYRRSNDYLQYFEQENTEPEIPSDLRQNAPQGQAAPEGTPVPAEPAKEVKPPVKSAEQTQEDKIRAKLDSMVLHEQQTIGDFAVRRDMAGYRVVHSGGDGALMAASKEEAIKFILGKGENSDVSDGLRGGPRSIQQGADTGGNGELGQGVQQSRPGNSGHAWLDENGAEQRNIVGSKAKLLDRADVAPAANDIFTWSEDQTGKSVVPADCTDAPEVFFGEVPNTEDSQPIVSIKHPRTHRNSDGRIVGGTGTVAVHETIHKMLQKLKNKSRSEILQKAYEKANVSIPQQKLAMSKVMRAYGDYYAHLNGELTDISHQQWLDMSNEERINELNKIPLNKRIIVYDKMSEEILCMLGSKDCQIGKYQGEYTAADAVRELLSDENDGVFKKNAFDGIDEKILAADEESIANIENQSSPNADMEASSPVGSGTIKQSKAAAPEKTATRNEVEAARGPETTYVSRTNEERSRVADSLLTGDEEKTASQKMEDQVKRLLEKDSWDDQDVVTAERIMYHKIIAIRDYQLSRGKKLPPEAFRALRQEYNALVTKHINEKSKAGQELQAQYMFTPEEKVMNRLAKTFLGFAKDGKFVGGSDYAKNAKIYAAGEDAVNRIVEATKNNDATALAQICKDMSDIRGVKKMFGPAAEFASNMENDILNSIAQQENGVEALNTLALGNVNALCDDMQPYKAVNAAKTIRIMNMLSNMSTIVNNVTNNIASGMTSTNYLSQWATDKAANAFRNISGEPVVAKSQKGWIANKEIRNAEWEALKMATLVQMYGINQEGGKLELSGDKGLFNPQANMFEQTMALYKFFIGMGVEATDEVKSAGLNKAMNMGIDKMLANGKITEAQAEEMRREAKHEVDRLLYKDDSKFANTVQYIRNRLNDVKTWGNDDVGTIGLGDIAMAFAKVPANVVRARLLATPEGCLYQISRYAHGVNKAKTMHSEVLAKQIAEKYAPEREKLNNELQDAYAINIKEAGLTYEEKQAKIEGIREQLAALDRKCWNEAREQCKGSVYKKLVKKRDNYSQGLDFDKAVSQCGYNDATEMSQFEMAQYSRSIGKAASSAGMMVAGAVLRAFGALRDFDNEPDDELRKMYAQKGYKGLMLNLSAIGRKGHEWRDGDHILSADFLEVIALPLAIGACATDSAILAEKGDKTKSFFKEMGLEGLGKAFEAAEDIPGMADAIGFYNAFNNQFGSDNAANGNKLWNSMVTYAANSLPSFFIPNAFTQAAAGLDNTVRDVYNTDNVYQQAWNIVKNKGGLAIRSTIPASVDMWGNERKYGENRFWGVINKSVLPGDRLVYHQDKYETEIINLSKAGYKGAIPKITVNGSFDVGDETYTLTADEKRTFKQNRNKEQAEAYKAFIDSEYYKTLTDEQKVAVLKDLKTECERDARQAMLNDRGLDNVEVTRSKWETELDLKDQIQYLSTKQKAAMYWDKSENSVSDFAGMDAFIKNDYNAMTDEMKKIMNGSFSHLDDLADAAKNGINSEKWQAAYNIYRTYTAEDEDGKKLYESNLENASKMWSQIQQATGFSDGGKEMKYLEDHMKLTFTGSPNTQTYDELVYDYGLSRESASKIYSNFSKIEPTKGYANVQDRQKWVGLTQCGLSDREQWDSFFAMVPSNNTKQIKNMTALRGQVNPQTGKVYTFAEAIHKLKLDVIYWKEVLPNGKEKKHEIK